MKVADVVACTLVAVSLAPLARGQQSPAAFIEKISGQVTLRSDNGTEQRLSPQKDAGRILYSGDVLKCASGVALGFTFDKIGAEKKSKEASDLCKAGPFSGEASQQAGLPAAAVEKLQDFKRAGRDKGTESVIFDPPNAGAIVAEKFRVQWRVRPPLDNFTAVLEDGSTELARVSNVDGAKGELDSVELKQALERVRDSGAHALRLVFKFERGSDQSVTFSVLSSAQEGQLQKALADVDEGTTLLPHIERAAIYDSFRLYGMVAGEYDAALLKAPESRDLLRASLQAHTRIGDLHRARELRDQLQRVEEGVQQ